MIAHLFNASAQLYRHEAGETPEGESYKDWSGRGVEGCREGKTSTRLVVTAEGERFVTSTRFYFRAEADVRQGDAARIGGACYRIVAAVQKRGIGLGASHVEVDLVSDDTLELPNA